MFNSDEWKSLLPPLVAILAPLGAKYGLSVDTISAALTGVVGLAVALYLNWNMRRVKETAIVSGHAPDVATAKALSVPAESAQSFASDPANRTRAFVLLALVATAALMFLLNQHVAMAQSPSEFNARQARATKGVVAPTTAAATEAAAPATGVVCTDLINLLPLGCTPKNSGTPSPLSGPLQDIIGFFSSDFGEAATLAVQIPALQDGNGQACWTQAASVSALLKAHPLPVTFKTATDLEALRLLNMSVNNMCANPGCTQMFTDFSNGISSLGLSIPIPSLTALCTKFPTIVKGVVTPASASTSGTN